MDVSYLTFDQRAEILPAFIKELKTTEKKQIRGRLFNGKGGCCALGIFAELLIEKYPESFSKNDDETLFSVDPKAFGTYLHSNLDRPVLTKGGIPVDIWYMFNMPCSQSLIQAYNDDKRMTFFEIAEEIEGMTN